jgi:hypothetical protein
MKKILCALTVLTTLMSVSKLNAQNCNIAPPVISNIRITTGATCTATFDLEYDLTGNAGNKYNIIYIYSGSLPSGFFGVSGTDVPTTATVNAAANVLATIEINRSTVGTTSANYVTGNNPNNAPDPSSFKVLPYSISVNANSSERFKILNITVPIACSGTVDLNAAIGSTNQNSVKDFQCITSGIPFRANDPILRGQLACSDPRSFTFSANTISATQITFSAYSDVARTMLLQAPAGFIYNGYGTTSPISITSYSNITLNTQANSNLSFGPFPYVSALGSRYDVYLSVAVTGNTLNTNSLQIENTCTLLPVSFTSFNASRNKENVSITWETAFEQDSKGFNVQRKTTADWKTLSFISAKANTSGTSSYTYSDVNNEKGISQYRIEQVDIDGKVKYTDIRSVRGLNEAAGKITMFPNPTINGAVNLVFENNSKRNIIISDMVGRVVKQLNDVSNNSITIENLQSGFYNIQIVDQKTNELSVQKLVVRKQ